MSQSSQHTNATTVNGLYSSLPCRGCTKRCKRFGRCNHTPWREQQVDVTDSSKQTAVSPEYVMHELTMFYDSTCPLCLGEMRQLKRYDVDNRIKLVDIYHQELCVLYPQIDRDAASRILHAISPGGELILGLDATCRAWGLVGRHRWLRITRLPLLRPVADLCYSIFARHRYRISFLLTGKSRCNNCSI